MKKKLFRVTTVPYSLNILLSGQSQFMSNHFEVTGISSSNKNDIDAVSKLEGIPMIPIELTRQITPIKDLKSVWKLYSVLKKEKPYIIHSHTPKAGTVSMLAAKLAGVPHRLHTVAGMPLLEAKGFKRLVLNTVEKLTYHCATKVYPNSNGLFDIILDQKFTSKDKLKVIGNGSSNGIDTSYFSPAFNNNLKNLRKDLNIQESDFVFVFVGRLVTDKGINELVASFLELSKKQKNIKLLLVGSFESDLDPLKPETLQAITTNKNIINPGWKNDVRPYLLISDCLVFPSYREGFPNVVLQAGAMELPGIVTNINGCNEIIKENISGFIIPVKNTEALQEAMQTVLDNPKKAKAMGIKSRQFIIDNFERKVIWKSLLKEYQSLK
ncbi:glycosyltransferase family 4 protein [Tamlana sp. 2_MG-2023]|uniref:glycosyltransferase family 4 protein n=1 Tax=unclassified Tamlana TaxID=2614803 RepID=UPI0026E2E2A1|nr:MULTISPECIES: glycosyltransferase family 4 protein [unclassified Tamlana]MDO6759412.1 glycosyltransferase family 4 protein [Tamlana sp. 2_MG-2023]MDO6790449.1 glycosyltransferase family 4 protein [Tamlana sp. 1_MG-2023]